MIWLIGQSPTIKDEKKLNQPTNKKRTLTCTFLASFAARVRLSETAVRSGSVGGSRAALTRCKPDPAPAVTVASSGRGRQQQLAQGCAARTFGCGSASLNSLCSCPLSKPELSNL